MRPRNTSAPGPSGSGARMGRPPKPLPANLARELRKLAQQINASEQRTDMLKARRDALIVHAVKTGAGSRAISKAAGVSGPHVTRISRHSRST